MRFLDISQATTEIGMQAKIIFDAATKPFVWQHVWAATGAFAFGCVIVAIKKLRWRNALSDKSGYFLMLAAGYFMMLAALVAVCYDSTHWLILRWRSVKALGSGNYEVVEGPVEDFHPMPTDGSSRESFSIGEHTFSYSDDAPVETTTCFDRTRPHGGPIHPGLLLRVKFVDNCILQIETLPPPQ